MLHTITVRRDRTASSRLDGRPRKSGLTSAIDESGPPSPALANRTPLCPTIGPLRVAVALGGTDRGRSGLSTWVREVVPRLQRRLEAAGGSLVALGGAADLAAYGGELQGVEQVCTPAAWDGPAASALWHLLSAGTAARATHADVLLLPAANRRMAARSPIPTVAVVHDLAQLRVPHKFDRLRMVYARWMVLRALRGADQLVAVSEATRRDLCTALGLPDARVRVVSNGVDAARFTPPLEGEERVRKAREVAGATRPYILYTARLEHPGKNHLRLLRAFAQSRACDTHQLLLAGADSGAATLIQGEIRRLGLSRSVSLLGYFPDALLPGLFAGADVVVMVGLYEGFGLPAIEALAAGRPLVASRTGALPEVAGPLAVFCDPEHEESIGSALATALSDQRVRERARREGPAWAASRSWEGTADGLVEACRAAMGS